MIGVAALKHSPIRNYIVPGLTSWMISGANDGQGCVRMFESSRHFVDGITPHSHRYDFSCQVLRGAVRNRIWHKDNNGELMTIGEMSYLGEHGKYETRDLGQHGYTWSETEYEEGEWYHMRACDIHSIRFSRGAQVLFFEGPSLETTSIFLEPFDEYAETIRTMRTEPWMFRKNEPK